MKTAQPPIDDPTLPSYECPEYRALKPDLKKMQHCWGGRLNQLPEEEAMEYLPKNYCEHSQEYERRLKRSHFDNQFRRTITGYSGVFSKFEFESNLKDTIENDADLCGSSFKALIDRAIQLAARDRYSFLFPQFYKGKGSPRNAAEEMRSGRRPYLSVLSASQVINWAVSNGRLSHVTIRESHSTKASLYGQGKEILYRVLRADGAQCQWELLKMVESPSGEALWSVQTVDEGVLVQANGAAIAEIPLIPMSLTDLRWWEASPLPFMELATANVLLYQIQSDRREIQYRLVPTLAVSPGHDATCFDSNDNLVLGGYLNLGTQGKAFIVEASGNGLPSLFQEEENIRASMRQMSLEFVQTSGPERKEVQVKLDLQDLQNNLERMANLIESSVQNLFSFLAMYAGISDGGRINIAVDISVFLDNLQDLAIAVQSKILSRETAVKRMVQLGYAENAEEELDRLMKESQMEADALANAIAPKEDPDTIGDL